MICCWNLLLKHFSQYSTNRRLLLGMLLHGFAQFHHLFTHPFTHFCVWKTIRLICYHSRGTVYFVSHHLPLYQSKDGIPSLLLLFLFQVVFTVFYHFYFWFHPFGFLKNQKMPLMILQIFVMLCSTRAKLWKQQFSLLLNGTSHRIKCFFFNLQ